VSVRRAQLYMGIICSVEEEVAEGGDAGEGLEDDVDIIGPLDVV
jgi:hypothetical protein